MSEKYEEFHKTTRKQKRIISDSDFTFLEIIEIVKKFEITGKTILDVGCGTGSLDFYLAKRANSVTGIDISKNAIVACKRDAKTLGVSKKTAFYVRDISKRLMKRKFDVVICLEVIEHIKNDKKLINNISKSLKKNGLLILSTPSHNAPLYKMGFLKGFESRVGHLRRYNMKSIASEIKKTGLTIVHKKKTEGIFRNFLFTSKIGGIMLKFTNKFKLGRSAQLLDKLSLWLFGESDLILVAIKK